MEPKNSQAGRLFKDFGTRKPLIFILLTIAVLVITIPVGVIFGMRKTSATAKSDVLVPLYVYPAPGAWDPLFAASAIIVSGLFEISADDFRIANHPNINFVVVVNPASGPGPGEGPDGNYTKEIPKLNSYANVRTAAYVSTDYAKRDVQLVQRDVETYSRWSENATAKGIGMRGIFLDETPTEYTSTSAQYYETIASAIRSNSGFGVDPFIIHNPGQISDPRYLLHCDLMVAFEGTYSTFQTSGFLDKISNFRQSSKVKREVIASIIHSVPTSLLGEELTSLVKDVRGVSGSIFITGLSVDYYASFWAGWPNFLEGMD